MFRNVRLGPIEKINTQKNSRFGYEATMLDDCVAACTEFVGGRVMAEATMERLIMKVRWLTPSSPGVALLIW